MALTLLPPHSSSSSSPPPLSPLPSPLPPCGGGGRGRRRLSVPALGLPLPPSRPSCPRSRTSPDLTPARSLHRQPTHPPRARSLPSSKSSPRRPCPPPQPLDHARPNLRRPRRTPVDALPPASAPTGYQPQTDAYSQVSSLFICRTRCTHLNLIPRRPRMLARAPGSPSPTRLLASSAAFWCSCCTLGLVHLDNCSLVAVLPVSPMTSAVAKTPAVLACLLARLCCAGVLITAIVSTRLLCRHRHYPQAFGA